MTRVTDPREKMANQLLMRGHATMKEILTASFGEWPPKGLDIDPNITHEQVVTFRPIVEAAISGKKIDRLERQLFSHGAARLAGPRIIYINRFLCCFMPGLFGWGALNVVMGHEALHVLQGDHFFRLQETFNGAAVDQKIKYDKPDSDIIMQDLIERESEGEPKFRKVDFVNGQVRGREVQALMHEILMEGYARWGRLPQTTQELWGALADAGLTPPPGISEQLSHDFMRGGVRKEPARQIERVNELLSPEGRITFWEQKLPALYGDLIEMYGDKHGRERFGFGINPRSGYQQVPAVRVRHAVRRP